MCSSADIPRDREAAASDMIGQVAPGGCCPYARIKSVAMLYGRSLDLCAELQQDRLVINVLVDIS